jgi:hypothetical protein
MISHSAKKLTEHKTAVVTIKNFRPFFSRLPLEHKKGMSEKAYLALDIGYVAVIGSIDEDRWGIPQDVESNPDLRSWSAGLREHGGGG